MKGIFTLLNIRWKKSMNENEDFLHLMKTQARGSESGAHDSSILQNTDVYIERFSELKKSLVNYYKVKKPQTH